MSLNRNRYTWLKQTISGDIFQSRFNFESTLRDLPRQRGNCIYWNGKKLFGEDINKETILQNLQEVLDPGTPMYEYIKNYTHQDGYLNNANSVSFAYAMERKNISIAFDKYRYDLISCQNGDVIFIERIYVTSYIDLNEIEVVHSASEDGRPIAICETVSLLHTQGVGVVNELIRDRIYMMDHKARLLFDPESGTTIKQRFRDSCVDVENELNNEATLIAWNNKAENTPEKELADVIVAAKIGRKLRAVDRKTLSHVLTLSTELINTPVDSLHYEAVTNNYLRYANHLKKNARLKMVGAVMIGVLATLVLAATVAALVITFGPLAPAAAAVVLAAVTTAGAGVVGTAGLVGGLCGSLSGFGLFRRGYREYKIAESMINIHHQAPKALKAIAAPHEALSLISEADLDPASFQLSKR